MAVKTDKWWNSTWYFWLGQPTEGDLDFIFENEVVAYVLPDGEMVIKGVS